MSNSAEANGPGTGDRSQRFLFELADTRGEVAHLDDAYREILAIHQYADGVARLLGEFLAASVLLSSNLKFEGKLVLQARSDGQIPLLMAECTDTLQVRGIARGAEQATSDNFDLLLHDGQLAITIDPTNGQRYQGIVPLQYGSLARSLDNYFQQSEQLSTRIWLAADGQRASGLLLQQLPPQITPDDDERQQHWEHVCALATTLQEAEMLALPGEELLYRLYHEDPLRLFEARALQFHCSCSRERTLNALSTLDPAEILELLEDLGNITMECEFCNQAYLFERSDLADLLPNAETKTLH